MKGQPCNSVLKPQTGSTSKTKCQALAAQLNSKPHIVTVVIEDIDEVTRINPEAREDLDSLIAEMTGVEAL